MEKKYNFTDAEIKDMASRFKAMSEPSRLKILRTLFSGEKCVTEIIEKTGLLQANVSKQLKILQRNGVLACRPAGLQRFYKITDQSVLELCNIVCKS
ncbi:MAG: metalloregulator ArsR/SmtB family transcription factor [Bacteroidetes bacterium]|nr:metalloregulator ArsR/SmtB family transcription factor [Bacteroidota bacterium]